MRKQRRLEDAYRFPGFRPEPTVRGIFGDPKARVVHSVPAGKKTACGACGQVSANLLRPQDPSRARPLLWRHPGVPGVRDPARGLPECGAVKQEKLPWLANNPFYTKRFAFYVGRRCRRDDPGCGRETPPRLEDGQGAGDGVHARATPTGRDARPEGDRHRRTLHRQGHNYRIVVSDLVRGRPIWFGGTDRSEKSMDLFFQWLGPRKCRGIRLAVMDMWKPFRNSTLKAGNAPQAGILYDKFHILKHLNEALDKVRKSEYARLSGKDRRFIKGQKYTLLSRRANLSQEGRQSLKALFKANRRLNKAYLLKEMFGQLWDYKREVWARRFFERWKSALRWQRLKPYEKFARMIEGHWDGIASYCQEENKVALGFVEGINNKIRVIQRRATDFETRSTSASRSSRACCRKSEIGPKLPTRLGEEP